jgi:murein DD-endopeptidase MepM/ murein hydrolase activator NlpD
MTVNNAGGNHVIVDLGNGRFAVYAHLQLGSIRVKKGDRVRRGEVLAKLGNSGNTSNPHLHFEVADRPSVVAGSGLPFVIDDFKSAGAVTGLEPLFDAKPAALDSRFAGRHVRQLPLNNSVVSFD